MNKKYNLTDELEIQILNCTEQAMTAKLWFNGRGPESTHHHASEEVNVFIEGEFDAIYKDTITKVTTGDSVFIPSNDEHGLHCLSGKGVIITTWSPPRQDFMKFVDSK